ncbi:hypothetical protein [Mucilaginibacter xinganensis]|uniref:Uncharacterized protein n=1 Tax=Mucilaginibacter xinganensis TaxID=1234841 RepID=A0A223NWK7_9SPHI|nr:hypothetical protein [Mucilaginibacter xinganensis]ASU34269.1 hypothetical protein MuYL_2380 [Mucilaginibacter xinganensis]
MNYLANNWNSFRSLSKYIFLLFAMVCYFPAFTVAKPKPSQKVKRIIRIEFNEKGQMVSTPPSYLTKEDQIDFVVNTGKDFKTKRVIEVYQRFAQTIKALEEKNDKGDSKILAAISLDQSVEAKHLLGVTVAKLADQLNKYVVANETYLKNQITSGTIEKDLQDKSKALTDKTYTDAELALIQVPSLTALEFPSYTVTGRIVNVNGLDIISECKEPLTLDPQSQCCWYVYCGSMPPFHFKEGPVRFEFELRMNNNIPAQLIDQISKSDALTKVLWAINTDKLKAEVTKVLSVATMDVPDPKIIVSKSDLKSLSDEILKKEQDPKTDMKADIGGLFPDDKTKLVYDKLFNLASQFDFLSGKELIAWYLQFAWVSGGQNISANPLVNGNLVGLGQKISEQNATLKKLKKDSVKNAAELILVENTSKTSNSAGNITALNKAYDDLLTAKSTNDALIDAANAALKSLKKQGSSDVINQLNKPALLSDSLLYQGLVYINNPGNYNKTFYAFMRNHDALEDFQLKGKEPAKGINETQRMYILVDNSPPKAKYMLKTTITPINLSDDVPPSGAEIGQRAMKAAKPLFTRVPKPGLDDVFSLYESLKNLYAPAANGILALPFHLTPDNSPDYLTRMVSHESPFKAPSTVSYQLLDSATSKNLNSEGTAYTYRYNKLYRFRIKAGIVYSFLQNKNYTINAATNTATYTNNYTGLAPSVGLQIFTTRLDIQSQRFFPHGAAPYAYVGYLYTGAPAANILLGTGWEIFSGFALTAGVHYGKSQGLTVVSGSLQEKDDYQPAFFFSLNIGLEAFNALFNTAKPTANPFK